MELEIDFGDEPIDEQRIESGGKMPAGWYRAKVKDIYPDTTTQGALKIVFEVVGGPFKGREQNYTLWDPNASTDSDKAKKAQDRILLIAGRIGARQEGSGKVNFMQAIGNEVVIQLALNKETWCDRCRKKAEDGRARKCKHCGGVLTKREDVDGFANIPYDGVFPLNHEKLADDTRAQLGITVPRREKKGPGDGGDAGGGGWDGGGGKPPSRGPLYPGSGGDGATQGMSRDQMATNAAQDI